MKRQANAFWINKVLVDTERCQLNDNGRIIPLEPKIIAVLQLLAEHAGEVVAYQTIGEQIWPDVVVAPSSLQRSIAILRKALGDSAKAQQLIVTHPKKGYSLTARVRWSEPAAASATTGSQSNLPRRVVLPLLLAAVVLLGWFQWPMLPQSTSSFQRISPVTATDDSENFVSVSSDGRYIAYNRDFDGFDGEIVLKALDSGQEWVLTETVRSLRGPRFSPDGQYLTYATLHTGNNQKCSRLNLLDLTKARAARQVPRVLLDCDPHSSKEMVFHSEPTWLSNNRLALLRATSKGSEVIQLDLDNNHQQQLYTSAVNGIYALSFSTVSQQLLIMSATPQNEHRMVLMDIDDRRWREVTLTVPPNTTDRELWRPSWHPDGNRLILAADRQLYELSLEGQFTRLSMLNLQQLDDPHYLPDGRRLIAVQGIADWDITEHRWPDGQLPVETKTDAAPFQETTHSTQRQRSNLRENQGQFQPGGSGLAFLSDRSGTLQLWYAAGNNSTAQRLSRLDTDRPVDAFLWSPDGRQLIYKSGDQLYRVDLTGQHQPLFLNERPLALYQWLPNDQLLLSGVRDGQSHILRYDMASRQSESLYQGNNYWAQAIRDQLFLAQGDGYLYQLEDNGPKHLAFMQDTKLQWRFFARRGKLFAQDKKQRLWSYDPRTDSARLLHYYHDDSKFITDYDAGQDRILTENRIAAQSEIVILE